MIMAAVFVIMIVVMIMLVAVMMTIAGALEVKQQEKEEHDQDNAADEDDVLDPRSDQREQSAITAVSAEVVRDEHPYHHHAIGPCHDQGEEALHELTVPLHGKSPLTHQLADVSVEVISGHAQGKNNHPEQNDDGDD